MSDETEVTGSRRWLHFGAGLLVVAIILGGSHLLRQGVEEDRSRAAGEWELHLDAVPTWIPAGFKGHLQELATIPRTVSLRSSYWRPRIVEALEENPWIERVERLDKEADGVRFEARFVRPVVGVQAQGGFLLCDSRGQVVDFAPGRDLSPSWRVPAYRSETGVLPRLESGAALGTPEFEQLFGLLQILWDGGIYERWASVLRRLTTRPRPDGDRFWILEAHQGPQLDWGRAPGNPRLAALPIERKLEHLERTLRQIDRLGDVPEVRLWDPHGPTIGAR